MVRTDLSLAIPEDCYGRVAPRSGLAWKHSIDTGAGVIDCDYRGPLKVILFNFSDTDFAVSFFPAESRHLSGQYLIPAKSLWNGTFLTVLHDVAVTKHHVLSMQVKTGDRIAQLILERITIADVQVVDDLDGTDRGEGGFGSTGGFGNKQENPTA